MPNSPEVDEIDKLDKIRKERIILVMIIIVVGVILISCSSILSLSEHEFQVKYLHLFPEVIRDVGIGFIVAGIVISGVEFRRTKQIEAENKIAVDKITTVWKTAIEDLIRQSSEVSILQLMRDDRIANEVKNYILTQNVIRRDMQIDIKLTDLEENPDYLLKKQKMSYKIENLSNDSTVESLFHFEEIVLDETQFIEFKIIDKPAENNKVSLSEKELDPKSSDYVKMSSEKQHLELKYNASIPKNGYTEVTLELKGVVLKNQMYHLAPPRICDGLIVSVTAPKNIRVTALPDHPNKEKFKKRYTTDDSWEIDAGILPYQGIQLKWEEKSEKV